MLPHACCLVLLLAASVHATGCLDESGAPVDWWFAYKLPRGFRYAYRDANTAASGGTLVPSTTRELDCGDNGCALGYTLAQVYTNKQGLAYVLYNDEFPPSALASTTNNNNKTTTTNNNNNTTTNNNNNNNNNKQRPNFSRRNYNVSSDEGGHTKGVMAFNTSGGGFWLVHSVPQFPELSTATFQWQASNEFGQSFLCISIDMADIDSLSKQLQVTEPKIYASSLPSSVSSQVPEFKNLIAGKHLKGTSTYAWRSGRTVFTSFTKNPSWGADLYEDLVLPGLGVSAGFAWETWRRSPYLPTYCAGVDGYKYTSANVNAIAMGSAAANAFPYTDDHSKWGVSLSSSSPYVCIGDINRMQSQRNRGGGTVCFECSGLWKSLSGVIAKRDTC